jgi:hypothetical protein
MAGTNKYFNFHSGRARTGEMQLVDDLLNEAIEIHGTDAYYIVRESEDTFDDIFGEDPLAYFQRAYSIPMYIDDVENYRGEGEFLSKFGLEARQGANFLITNKHFLRYIPQELVQRPREGDLIWVPVFGKMFEIKFVDKDKNFYQLGRRDPYFWEIYTEMWKFSQNKVDTGIDEIDEVKVVDSFAIRIPLNTSGGVTNFNIDEIVFQGPNLNYSSARATVSAWDRPSGNLDIIHIKGVFVTGQNVTGNTTNTSYIVTGNVNPQLYNRVYDTSDNAKIQEEANTIINFNSSNPWGMP